MKYESFEKKKSVSGLGFFSVNGLGLKFVRFLKKENIVRISEKSAGKSSEKKWKDKLKYENSEKNQQMDWAFFR